MASTIVRSSASDFASSSNATRERRLVALARIDIRLRDEPTEDAAFRIPHRQTLRMEPPVNAIRAPLAELDVVRLPALD
jgi:hypothetical protein